MTLRFLGTRGELPIRSRRHWRHTATMVESEGRRVLIDYGRDWTRGVRRPTAEALVITHAHPDHVDAIRKGSPYPVYATRDTWRLIGHWPITDRHVLRRWTACAIGGIEFEAVPVHHSLRAPAAGYRITAGSQTVFYVPDVADIPRLGRALAGVAIYIGDGASVTRPILRTRHGGPIGHASIATQLDWCQEQGVRRAVFTHCGSQIVRNHRRARRQVRLLGRERGIDADLASDGESIRLGPRRGTP